MTPAQKSQLTTLAIIVVVLAFGIARRIRPQPLRPTRVVVTGAIIVVVLLASFAGSGLQVIENPIALVLIPVFIAAGAGLGFLLVRTMTFWVDQPTGQLWMRGGALFAVILVATIALRFGASYIMTGNAFSGGSSLSRNHSTSPSLLSDISADLLFLSLGLWAARAYLLFQRHRAFLAAAPQA